MSDADRIKEALSYATWGAEDGEHHKAWVIDQMVRAMTGCPTVGIQAIDVSGQPYTYPGQGESEEYRQFRERVGEEWDEGIAP